MKNAFKFILKAFFGGCIGCFGALTFLLMLALVISLVFGPSIINNANSLLDSLSHSLNQLMPFSESGTFNTEIDMENLPVFEVYLTSGDDPGAAHVESFSTDEYQDVWFWVRAPEGTALQFELLLTMPDRGQVQFGPTFNTDPSGNPRSCGQFGDFAPDPGSYKLEAQIAGTSVTVGVAEFEVME